MKKQLLELTDKELEIVVHALFRLQADSKLALKNLRDANVKDFSPDKKRTLKDFSRTGNRLYKKIKRLT